MSNVKQEQKTKAQLRRASLDELLTRRRAEREVDVHLDPDAVRAATSTADRLARAKLRREPEAVLTALEREADAARQHLRDTTVTVLLRALSREEHERLLRANQAGEDEQREWESRGNQGRLPYSMYSYPPALVSACTVEPHVPLEDAARMYREWEDAEFGALFVAAYQLCTARTHADALGKG